jgi:hypothetical protein
MFSCAHDVRNQDRTNPYAQHVSWQQNTADVDQLASLIKDIFNCQNLISSPIWCVLSMDQWMPDMSYFAKET